MIKLRLNFEKLQTYAASIHRYCTSSSLFSIDPKTEERMIELIGQKDEIMKISGEDALHKDALHKSFLQYSWHTNEIEYVEPTSEQIRRAEKATEYVFCEFRFGQLNDALSIRINNIFMDAENEQYRTEDVVVRCPDGDIVHMPRSEAVPKLMKGFIAVMNAEGGKMNPLLAACLTKVLFVSIHPFEDGNGRSSRALLNGILRQNQFPFVCVPTDEIETYYAVLKEYETKRDINPCLNYLCSCVDRSLNLYSKDLMVPRTA